MFCTLLYVSVSTKYFHKLYLLRPKNVDTDADVIDLKDEGRVSPNFTSREYSENAIDAAYVTPLPPPLPGA
jgi:hypothetical protein